MSDEAPPQTGLAQIQLINELPTGILQKRDRLRNFLQVAAMIDGVPEEFSLDPDTSNRAATLLYHGINCFIQTVAASNPLGADITVVYDVADRLTIPPFESKGIDETARPGLEVVVTSQGLASALNTTIGTEVNPLTNESYTGTIQFLTQAQRARAALNGQESDGQSALTDNELHPFLTGIFPVRDETEILMSPPPTRVGISNSTSSESPVVEPILPVIMAVPTGLAPREREIFLALGERKSNKTIAQEFGLGIGTVNTHVKSIRQKLGISHRAELVEIAATYQAPTPPTSDVAPLATATERPVGESIESPAEYIITPNPKISKVTFIPQEGEPYVVLFTHRDKLLYVPFAGTFQACVDQGFIPTRTSVQIAKATNPIKSPEALMMGYRRHESGIFNVSRSSGFSLRIAPEDLRRIIESSGKMTVQLDSAEWLETRSNLHELPRGKGLKPFIVTVNEIKLKYKPRKSKPLTKASKKITQPIRSTVTGRATGEAELPSTPGSPRNLSPRERQILTVFGSGITHYKDIARNLSTTPGNVAAYLSNMRNELGQDLAAVANLYGLAPVTPPLPNTDNPPAPPTPPIADESTLAVPSPEIPPAPMIEPVAEAKPKSTEVVPPQERGILPLPSPAEILKLTPVQQRILTEYAGGPRSHAEIAKLCHINRREVPAYVSELQNRFGNNLTTAALRFGFGDQVQPTSADQPIVPPIQEPPQPAPVNNPAKETTPTEPPSFSDRDQSILSAYGAGATEAKEIARLTGTSVGNVYTYVSSLRKRLGTSDLATASIQYGFGPKVPAAVTEVQPAPDITQTAPVRPTTEPTHRVPMPPKPDQRISAAPVQPDRPIIDEDSGIMAFAELEGRVLERIGELGDQYSVGQLAKEFGKSSETISTLLNGLKRTHRLDDRVALINYARSQGKKAPSTRTAVTPASPDTEVDGIELDFDTLPEAQWNSGLLRELDTLLRALLRSDTKVTDPRHNPDRKNVPFEFFPEYYLRNNNATIRLLDAIGLPLEGDALNVILNEQGSLNATYTLVAAMISLEKKTKNAQRADIMNVKKRIIRVMNNASITDEEIDRMADRPFQDVAQALASRVGQAAKDSILQ